MNSLFVIPARGGSKGIPGKNIRMLNGKPLIHYSIEYARLFTSDENICVSTDSTDIADCSLELGYNVPFFRPKELSQDDSGTFTVLEHALKFYSDLHRYYENIILLQPTSPFRKAKHLQEAMSIFSKGIDMVVSVKRSKENPYFTLFEEDNYGFLKVSKQGYNFETRQETPATYAFNGSLYIINSDSLTTFSSFRQFEKIKKYVMEDEYSVDIDSQFDWDLAEFLISSKRVNI